MKIRTITGFLHPGAPVQARAVEACASALSAARSGLGAAGYEVQTTRLATPPFPRLLPTLEEASLIAFARELEALAASQGVDYVSLGPALLEFPHSFGMVVPVLGATQNIFLTGMLTRGEKSVSLPAVRMCAEIIHQAACLAPDGFTNLRFAALANVPPGTPFFPAAYHSGDQAAFALGCEAADLAVEAFSHASNLAEARYNLVEAVETHARQLEQVSRAVSRQSGVHFAGIDFTLAPFVTEERSIGAALERLGVLATGAHGSLAAAAFLTSSLDQARFTRTGFNGIMMPVLEDFTLARRAAEGRLSVDDLLFYSAVCSTGLDTLPLPGDTSPEQLAAIMLDMAALAIRLDKPLTARLMPIPGKAAGEMTSFDFGYFANSRVLSPGEGRLSGLLAGDEDLPINKLGDRR